MQVVYEAIDRSISRDEVVHISLFELARAGVGYVGACERLFEECEGETVANGEHEFWGVDLDRRNWRVHVQLPNDEEAGPLLEDRVHVEGPGRAAKSVKVRRP